MPTARITPGAAGRVLPAVRGARRGSGPRRPGAARANRLRPAHLARRGVLHLVLGAGALSMVVPFVWMVLTSLKSQADIAAYPPRLLPRHWIWSNYPEALHTEPFVTYFRNSLLIAVGHTVINVVLASAAGYALARIAFRGRTVIFIGVLTMMMVPPYTKLIPQYLITKSIPFSGGNDYLGRGGSGWLDTWWALIIPGALTPFAIFLFRQFYLSLPRDLEEAARIDGMGEFGIYARVMTPLVKPAVVTVALLTFENGWNNFIWPLLVTTRSDLRVIQVGLAVFGQSEPVQWGYLMVGSALATLPIVVLFLFTQRYFVESFATAGLK